MLAYYIDHNVRAAIVQGLRRHGIDCLTALEDGRARAKDPLVLDRSTSLSRVLFTQDEDFLGISAERIATGVEFAGIVYATQLGITIGQAIYELRLVATCMSAEEMRNQLVHLPL